ncbi:MAG: hypothetical protein FWG58_00755 [Methanomassiliicoccaceae archaeon]|nr:hypothetical protein [Methanomassiliicoccaceae archaeon]
MASFDALGKDMSLFGLIVGAVALIIIVFPVAVLIMGVIALLFGLINFLKNNNDMLALISLILGIVVIIFCCYWNYLR